MQQPLRSRPPSRSQSRAHSPALSVKSRRSMISARNIHRNSYTRDLTDDEDSELEDFDNDFIRAQRARRDSTTQKSNVSRRSRKNSTQSSFDLDDETNDSEQFIRGGDHRSSIKSNRDRKGNSSARSVQNFKTTSMKDFEVLRKPETKIVPKNIRSDSPESLQSEFEEETHIVTPKKKEPELVVQSKVDQVEKDVEVDAKKEEEEEEDNAIVEDERGPPPPAPDHEWQCEHCTFVNEANSKICTICCKTPTQAPPKLQSIINGTSKKTIVEKISKMAVSPSEDDSTDDVGKKKGRNRKISFFLGTKTK